MEPLTLQPKVFLGDRLITLTTPLVDQIFRIKRIPPLMGVKTYVSETVIDLDPSDEDLSGTLVGSKRLGSSDISGNPPQEKKLKKE